MIKVLYLPLNVSGSEQIGTERGFRAQPDLDVQVFDYLQIEGQYGRRDMNEKLVEFVNSWRPDWVHMQLQETNVISEETLQRIRPMVKVMTDWNGDIRVRVPIYQQLISPYFDIKYLGYDHLKKYEPYCKQVKYWPIAVDSIESTTYRAVESSEIVFIGGHYGADTFPDSQRRYDLMVALSREFPQSFGCYGSGWPQSDVNAKGPVPLKDQGSYYHAAKVCISINHFNDVAYWSERLLWCFASGTPTIVKRTPNKEFKENQHYLGFNSIEECIKKIDFALDHPDEVQAMAQRAKAEILDHHTWEHRVAEIVPDVKALLG